MKYILGKKLYMTQIFKDNGTVVPITVVSAGPCYIAQVKTKNKEGYSAIQVGYGNAKKTRLTKPLQGHLKSVGKELRYLREFRISPKDKKQKVGDEITVNVFQEGDIIQATGISKGKGFQGVVKRHGFAGSPATHGHKDQLRMPGSIGATDPQRVFKGKRMGGHMGSDTVTVKNLKIVKVDMDKHLLYISGAVPGARNGLLKIQTI